MPSQRRIKVFALVILIFVLVTLYVTGAARQTRSSQFYTKTQDALAQARAHKESSMQDHNSGLGAGDGEVGKRLKEAEEAAKRAADRKGDEFHGEHVKEKVLSDKKAKEGERRVPGVATHYTKKELGIEKPLKGQEAEREQTAESEEDHKVKNELNAILKRSPSRLSIFAIGCRKLTISKVIIFSKSYCPYSKKAKHILLDIYKITPPPYVVELDLHELGPQLQAQLGQMTGRKTVPNILINGRSIGGGDDVQLLHDSGELAEKVKSMGGKRMEVTLVTETNTETKPKNRRVRI
jgi:glutaredoxin